MKKENNIIWTIGHSTRSLEEFVAMLHSFNIQLIADIRSLPGSRKFPQFNKEALEISLPQNDIQYVHIKDLGGRRKGNPNSKNTGWRHVAFRSYADFMQTDAFKKGAKELEKIALKSLLLICAPKPLGGVVTATEHPYTAPARIVNGELNYEKEIG